MGFELTLGSRIRSSPFFDASVADGACAFTVYNHMYMPTSYGDPAGEYDRLINKVAMWDVAVERQVEISGLDAGRLADYLCARDLSNMSIGQGKYAPLCDHDGILINDPIVMKLDDGRYWFSIADSDVLLWAKAVGREGGFDATVREPDVSPLAIQGPSAENVVAALLGDWVCQLRHFGFREFELDGMPLVVARSGWSKQGGFEIYLCRGTEGKKLWDAVKRAGAAFGIGPGAPNAVERLESGLLSFGADSDNLTNPFEVGLGKFVDLDSGSDFIGKQALTEICHQGVLRRQVGLFIDCPPLSPNRIPGVIRHNGQVVGRMSAMAHSPRLKKNIAVGLIDVSINDADTALEVTVGNETWPAVMTAVPFI